MTGGSKERLGGILLARLDSSRLPGKQLLDVRGRPVLDWLLERVALIEDMDEVVLATTDRPVDDPLETFARHRGLPVFRGHTTDVARRVLDCARERRYDAWARLLGDSPLFDFELFNHAIRLFRSGDFDAVTNAQVRTFPVGNSIEIFDTEILADGYARMTEEPHFEHVTAYFYDHADEYRIHNIVREAGPMRSVSLGVDTPEDLRRYVWMLDQVAGDHLRLRGEDAIALALAYQRNNARRTS